MIYDTHSHLNFWVFDIDRKRVIEGCLKEGIGMINVGTNYETSKKAVEIAQKYKEGVYASVGLHPINFDTGLVKMKIDKREGSHFEKEFNVLAYEDLAKSEKVVAIGEIGLDYYWRPKGTKKKEIFKQKQKELLKKELELAKKLNLPVIFHCRMAHQDLIYFLKENEDLRPKKAVMHGFVGNLEELNEYFNFGFYIGFNGIIFKKIEKIDFEKIIKATPLEKILIETDCPYLSPPGYFERNDPMGVKIVIEKIAQIKNSSFEEITTQTTKNVRQLFKI